jgi:poly-gamma-glutamate capsule biosynthesis protein CapA/YwtB (metallophosphatase superfamily)
VSALLFFLLCAGAAQSTPTSDGYLVAIGGDVSLARGIAARARKDGWSKVLAPVRRALDGADARMVNLESAIGPCLPGGTVAQPRLCGSDGGLAALLKSGITAIAVANNHALDAGPSQLKDMHEALELVHVTVLGTSSVLTGKPVSERLGPIQVIAANLSRPAHPPDRDIPVPTPGALAAIITQARQRDADRPILVVLHGGREFGDEPSEFEHGYAEAAAGAGAAAVVFHGAHMVHPVEYVHGVPVHFGLGNLLFDQRDPRASGQVVLLRFRAGRPAQVVEVRNLTR